MSVTSHCIVALLTVIYLLSGKGYSQATPPDTTIIIKAIAGLQYDQPRLIVKPKKRVRIILQNYDDMAHNLVVTQPNTRLRVVNAALRMGADGAKNHYIPKLAEVLAHTETVEPDDSDTLLLTLDEGAYPFVCTYPGHGSLMYGVIYATRDPPKLPAPDADPSLPVRADPRVRPRTTDPRVRPAAHSHARPSDRVDTRVHPYDLKLPAVYRTFMPDAGPAAIAVGLPGNISYCWDAGTCQLRYVWVGGFVDMNDQWDGKGQKLTKLVGDIIYKNPTGNQLDAFPLRLAKTASVRYRGYRLVNRFPAFRYEIGSMLVEELMTPTPDKRGLVRYFTLPPNAPASTFRVDAQPGISYKVLVNNKPALLKNGVLAIPPKAKQFTIIMSW